MGWQNHPVAYYHYQYGVHTGSFTNECNNYGLAG
jgi:hypothetical protein